MIECLDPGKSWYWMEICSKQALDFLFWRRWHRTAPLQHHPYPKVCVLHLPLDTQSMLWSVIQDDQRTYKISAGKCCFDTKPWCKGCNLIFWTRAFLGWPDPQSQSLIINDLAKKSVWFITLPWSRVSLSWLRNRVSYTFTWVIYDNRARLNLT